MITVRVPVSDVNSDTVRVVRWFVADRSSVGAGVPLVEIETSKAILEVESPCDGFVLRAADEGAWIPLDRPLAHVFEDESALAVFAAARIAAPAEPEPGVAAPRASAPARRRAAELGVDLATIASPGMISVRDVEAAHAAASSGGQLVARPWLPPLGTPSGVARIVLIGGGSGATQVLEILRHAADRMAVGIVDDTPALRGTEVQGVPVVGTTADLADLHRAGAFDAAIVTIGAPVEARRRLRESCDAAAIPLANAIDPSARVAIDAALGEGNVVCAFVHIGTGAVVGRNNFFSAYNSFDHHCRVGDDCSTGPGCMASGKVVLGSRVRLGTGIFIEPGVRLGHGVHVASGAVVVRDVPDAHTVKTRVMTTAVVPPRP